MNKKTQKRLDKEIKALLQMKLPEDERLTLMVAADRLEEGLSMTPAALRLVAKHNNSLV